jgi:hypothetical protein
MPAQNAALLAFNRGIVSKLALARTDLKRTALSAEVMTNWMPRVLGSMMLRPGLGFLGDTKSDAKARFLEFIFSLSDKALIELTSLIMRVWVSDALITRVAVGSAVTNGTFPVDLTGWTDNDEAGGVSVWAAPGYMSLSGNGTAAAIRDQQVTVAGADQNKEHALRIVIARGPVTLRVGSALGGDQYITETSLDTGTHSLAFTPTGDFFIRFLTRRIPVAYVSNCTVEAAGVMELTAPWIEADMKLIRYDESGSILFCATSGYQQRAIERRAVRSWSVVLYAPEDGPFRVENVGPTTIAASAITGDITLTASIAIFRSTHVGALFSLTSVGQDVVKAATALNDVTDSIRVTGVGTTRAFTIILTGFFDGVRTLIVERSYDNLTGWTAVPTLSWVAAVTTSFNDGLDNQIVYYRLKVSVVGGAGTTTLELKIGTGSIAGVARITGFTSSTVVSAQVLKSLGGTAATAIWAEGSWSDFRGYPTCVAFHQGRLWWGGKGETWGSVSDGFYSFDSAVLGDSGPINRSIGSGPVDNINWLLAMQRLFLGADMSEFQVVTSSLDEPITPTNFQIRPASTQGSSTVTGIKIDARGVFVRRGGTRVFELAIDPVLGDYASVDLTAIVPDLFENPEDTTVDRSIIDIGVQRLPDTRVHCVKADGTVGVLIFDKVEQVNCWINLTTDGTIEDVSILPGTPEDQVYYSVKRTINGATKRYLERWAVEADARGAAVTKLSDAYLVYSGASTTTITGLSHLEAKTVTVWGNTKDLGTYTVSGGQITGITEAVTYAVVGISYTAQWQSAKLAYASQKGTALTQKKNVSGLGCVLVDTHAQGLKYGSDFSNLDNLPMIEDGAVVDPNKIWSEYDKASFVFPGQWDTDARVCLQAASPRPCTVSALVITIETNEKS